MKEKDNDFLKNMAHETTATLYLEDLDKGESSLLNISFVNLKSSPKDVYETFYNKLVKLPSEQPVRIFLHTNGSSYMWTHKICHLLRHRKGKSSVYVKNSAHSSGTCIALAADELYLAPEATLSPIDAQINLTGDLFATSVKNVGEIIENPLKTIQDIYNRRGEEFYKCVAKFINEKTHDKETVMRELYDRPPLHHIMFFPEDLEKMGVKYSLFDPNEIKDTRSTGPVAKWWHFKYSTIIIVIQFIALMYYL